VLEPCGALDEYWTTSIVSVVRAHSRVRWRRCCSVVVITVVSWIALSGVAPARDGATPRVRTVAFTYRAHSGARRTAYLVVPAWYGPKRHPPLPIVVSPHGRGVDGSYNLRFWGDLPARGRFALVSPDGQGRRLPLYSWGYAGQITDLARMPELARRALPWLTLERGRFYAIGDSMGGQEVLLLAARRGVGLAGVAAFDPVTNMSARYAVWARTPGERRLRPLARVEFGASPAERPRAYAIRSPDHWLRAIAASDVPLQLWWSHRDRVITDQAAETGSFYRRLVRTSATAPVQEIVGYWQHAHEMHPDTQLAAALACFGLIAPDGVRVPAYTQPDGPGGAVEELAPEAKAAPVPFTPSFCGRALR
jgi:poly(3-hydroxybutyrate) depolymerase